MFITTYRARVLVDLKTTVNQNPMERYKLAPDVVDNKCHVRLRLAATVAVIQG
jgi:hypothetical protein